MSKTTLLLALVCGLASTSAVEAKQPILAQPLKLLIGQSTIQTMGDLAQELPSNGDLSYVVLKKPSDTVSSKYTDIISQAVFFVSDPVDFATYFPAEYAFFFQYGLVFLEPYLDFDFSVYNDLYEEVASSTFGTFFTEAASFTEASYIDYLYDYLFFGFDIAKNTAVESDSQLLSSDTYSTGSANVQQSKVDPNHFVAYDYSYYGYYNGYGYIYDYYYGYYYYGYGQFYGYIKDIYYYYPYYDSATEIITYPDGETFYYYY